jgi:hypothetical protein
MTPAGRDFFQGERSKRLFGWCDGFDYNLDVLVELLISESKDSIAPRR